MHAMANHEYNTRLKRWGVNKVIIILVYSFIYFDGLVTVFSSDTPNRTLAFERSVAGFISVDCGMTADSRYDSDAGGLYYISDAGLIDTGVNRAVNVEYSSTSMPVYNRLRSFPEGIRNCYTLKPLQGRNSSYLIRARFLYGNYDGLMYPPTFDLYVGVNLWETVILSSINHDLFYELMYAPSDDYIHVCLVNTGSGVPFISGLELRPLNNSIYKSTTGALRKLRRYDAGSAKHVKFSYSIDDDPYGRLWAVVPTSSAAWGFLRYNISMNTAYTGAYELPPSVIGTAAIPVDDSGSLVFQKNNTEDVIYQVYWHFAEIQKLGINDSREFTIYTNGQFQSGKISPNYMHVSTIVSPATRYDGIALEFNITRTAKSTLPPILNALEIYIVLNLSTPATSQDDVKAITDIKMNFAVAVLKGWKGDPCLPKPAWDGLDCSHNHGNQPPRITSLNLSFSGLAGDIPHSLSALTSLTYLNLSYNSLTGAIPDFLAQLPSLHTIDLRNNKLTGRVPIALSKRVQDGVLHLSLEDNPDLCVSNPCMKKNRKKIEAISAAVASIILIVTPLAAFCIYKQKKQARNKSHTSVKSDNREFTYFDVMNMTKNFQNIIGKGGSGTVYHGCLQDDTPVAVKMLNPSCTLSLKLFRTEVELLTRVHHRNLVSLIGYCEEGAIMALIYELIANGNLQQHLTDKEVKVLGWKERLQIAIDAAQGLEYMHSGCTPPIVHRDMKTSNILLDENLHAKISDFGISKAFCAESNMSSLTTNVVGTHGYLDPEYYITQRLHKKSDVYSFGVVLLELITGHPSVITSSMEPIHVISWTTPKLESGDINCIVDKRLQGLFETNSAWKALEIAMMCVSPIGIQRPSMSQVLVELNDCLAIEIGHGSTRSIGNQGYAYQPTLNVGDNISIADSSIEMGPSAR